MGGDPYNACFLSILRTRTHGMSTPIGEDVRASMPLNHATPGTRSPSAGHQSPVRSMYLSTRGKHFG